MMKGKKIYTKVILLVIVLIMVMAGAKTFAATAVPNVTNIKVTNITGTSAKVSWSAVSGATQYKVYYRLANQNQGTEKTVTGTSTQITGLTAGTKYCVNVKAVGGSYNSSPVTFTTAKASSSTTKPGKVTGLKASNITNDSAKITWNKLSGATGYKVYLNVPGIGYTYVGYTTETYKTVGGFNAVTGNDAGLTYKAKIVAYNSAGDSSQYAEVTFKTPAKTSSSSTTKPGKVTGLKASDITSDSVKLTWNKLSGATGYRVYLYIPGTGYVHVKDTSETYQGVEGFNAVTGNDAGLTYKAKVIAYNAAGDSSQYAEVSFKTPAKTSSNSTTKPGQVTNLKTKTIEANVATFSYNAVSGATEYEIYLKTATTSYKSIGTIPGTDLKIKNLTAGTKYYVKVRACNSAGVGNFSNEVTFTTAGASSSATAPAQVINVKATPTSDAVTVTWSKVTGATEYQVSIWIPGIGYAAQAKVSTTSKYISDLTPGETYKVKVVAYNGNTAGKESAEVTFKTAAQAVGQVTGLKATNITNTSVRLMWNSVSGATGYKVYVNIPGIGYTYVADAKTTYQDVGGFDAVTGNDAGLTYKAKVVAYNNAGSGKESAEVTFKTPAATKTPDQVTGIAVTPSINTASVKWNVVSGATQYEIFINNKSIGVTTKNSVNITKLVAKTTYKIKIRAYIGATPGAFSAESTFTTKANTTTTTTPTEKLGQVTGVTISNITEKGATIGFSKVSGAQNYRIYVSPVNSSSGNTFSTSTNSITLNTLNQNTEYEVYVEAYKTVNGKEITGALSNQKTFTTLEKVTVGDVGGFSISNITTSGATFTYNPVSNATGYEIKIREAGKTSTNTLFTTKTSTSTAALQAGTTYYAKIRAYREENGKTTYGNYSAEQKLTTLENYKVRNLKITSSTRTAVYLSWSSVPSATYYSIYYREKGTTQYSIIGGTRNSPTSISTSIFKSGKTYEIVVRAQYTDSAGVAREGDYSLPVTYTMP